MRGTVKFFNRQKGFGALVRGDGQGELFLHASALAEPLAIPLYEGEEVDFELGEDPRKGPIAANVRRVEPRFRGTVEKFEKGFGFIRPEGADQTIFAHHTSILGTGFKRLEEGESVEYCLVTTDRGTQASRVLRVDTRPPLLRFGEFSDFDKAVEDLFELAHKEDWEYRHTESKKARPVLRSYLLYTFARLEQENKIAEAEGTRGQRLACFNTGLATPRQEPIFAVFNGLDAPRDGVSWRFFGFCRESDRLLTHFPVKPDLANYFSDPTELLYDTRVELVVDFDHIIGDNKERFPREFRDNEFALRGSLDGAIAAAKRRVRRNYKAAIPNFYRGKLQLLLPLCLVNPERADLALVVARENKVYRASTVLTLDMAYNNARLIARPDREWLDP